MSTYKGLPYYEGLTEGGKLQYVVWMKDGDSTYPVALTTENSVVGFLSSLTDREREQVVTDPTTDKD